MMFTVETNYAVRNGIMYGVAKITGPRGVRTIAVHAPLPKNTGITISGEHTEIGWFGGDIFKAVKKATKSVVKATKSAASSVAKNPLKAMSGMALGGLNLHWVADAVARKIPGYHAVTDKFGITKYADAMHDVGKLSFNDLKKLKLTKKAVASKLGMAVNEVVKREVGVSIPAVGKAAAAYVTASSVLKSAGNADKYAAAAKATMGALQRKSRVPANSLAGRIIATGLKRGGAKGVEAVLTEVQTRARAGLHAKKIIAETIRRAQAGDPVAKRFQSTLAIAKRADNKLKAVKKVVAVSRERKGLLVLPDGEILRGNFNTNGTVRL